MSNRLELATGRPRFTLTRTGEGGAAILELPSQGPRGIRGLQGDPGEGRQGDPGPKGDRGEPGATTIRVLAASGTQASWTGGTAEHVMATVTIPAGAMGPNGRLRCVALWSATNNANAKTIRARFGGTAGAVYSSQNIASSAVWRQSVDIDSRETINSQVGKPVDLVSFGGSTGALVTSAIDTDAADVDLVLSAQLANAGDTIRLEAYVIELLLPPDITAGGLYVGGDGVIITPALEIHVDRTTVPPVTDPIFYGDVMVPTALSASNDGHAATTAFVHTLINALSTVYLTAVPATARSVLGLGALALLNTISWADTSASLRAALADMRTAADQKFLTPKIVFDAAAFVALTDAATIAWDCNNGFNFSVTITTNRILGFPSNPKVGQCGFIDVAQPAAGGKLLDYAAGITFDAGTKPTIDSAGNRVSSLYYFIRSSSECRISLAFNGVR